MQWLVGVDEAGRGPLAGPVSVGVVAVPKRFDIRKAFPGINDSKQLTEEKREEIYKEALARAKAGDIKLCARLSSALYIDTRGITKAVRRGVWSGVRHLADPETSFVKLDGLLVAPPEYKQETIIKGDALEPVISLASIVAKVRRDRLMRTLAVQYPEYGFAIHKGYGTAKHRAAIGKFGLCELHRKTFCKIDAYTVSKV
ncbi:MAG: rnhB [Candidatus Adlerbacteria bacterium]|nr:rnhB [Candidatus Adlerbacteria bacterium]